MAKTDERVMKMVEEELAQNPDVSGDDLFEKAKALNPGVARMSRRQFHARYPLQVKRKQGGARKKKTGGKKATTAKRGRGTAARQNNHDAVRQVFLRFAQDVAGASDSPKDLVKLVLGVDRYVDEALRAAGR